jgi:hypothetical protein
VPILTLESIEILTAKDDLVSNMLDAVQPPIFNKQVVQLCSCHFSLRKSEGSCPRRERLTGVQATQRLLHLTRRQIEGRRRAELTPRLFPLLERVWTRTLILHTSLFTGALLRARFGYFF